MTSPSLTLSEGEGDETRPPSEGGDGDAGVEMAQNKPVLEQVVVEPVRVSTEAQMEGPAIGAGAGAPPWWLRASPPWALPRCR
jgi:hypothetical protein